MGVSNVREKLYDYIRVADDKKLRAIYTMLEEDIDRKREWWKDNETLKDLDSRVDAWKSGKEKAVGLDAVRKAVGNSRQKQGK